MTTAELLIWLHDREVKRVEHLKQQYEKSEKMLEEYKKKNEEVEGSYTGSFLFCQERRNYIYGK